MLFDVIDLFLRLQLIQGLVWLFITIGVKLSMARLLQVADDVCYSFKKSLFLMLIFVGLYFVIVLTS